MPSKWVTAYFGDLIASGVLAIGDGYRAKNNELEGDGLPFLRAAHVRDTHIDFVGVERFPAEMGAKLAQKTSKSGDVVITTKGNSTGRVAFVTSKMPTFVYSPHLSFWRSMDTKTLSQPFLRAWSRSPEFVTQLDSMSRSTDMAPYLSLSDQKRLQISLPPVEEQAAIGGVFDGIEERITTLRETNATLEAIAQALFKSWFVDYDPVRAKVDGRDTEGVPPEVADLFPSEFEDSELGAMPKGWRVGTFQELTEVLGGSTPSTKDPVFWEEGVHYWATPKDLSGMDTPVLLETERKVTDAGLEKISSGLLPVGTVLLSSRAPIGYLAIAEVPVAVNQGFIAMKVRRGVSNLFLLRMVQVRMDDIKSRANGSTFLEISKGAFRPIPVLVPPTALVQAFDGLVRPFYQRLVENQRERATLTELRDSLLPRLMSGKLRIPISEEVPA